MTRISELPPATAANPTDQLETNQAGTSRRLSVAQVSALFGGTYAPISSPAFTGNPTAPTPPLGDNDSSVPTTAWVQGQGYAPLISPQLVGVPTAPTAILGDNDNSLATTAFVTRAIAAIPPLQAADPDVISWWTAVNTNGGSASVTQIIAANALITALRTAGAYALMDDIWLLANADASSVQSLVSLKQRRLATAFNAPTFTKKGVQFVGTSSQYINTGFIPSTGAVSMTGSNIEVGLYSAGAGIATSTIAFGVAQSATQQVTCMNRTSGGQYNSGLDGTATSFGTNPTSIGLTSLFRNGTTWGGRSSGVDSGTTYTAASSGTTLPTLACFIGANNSAGTPATFYTGLLSLVFIGADLTIAREPAVYAAIQAYMSAIGALDSYVSATSGSNANAGDQAHPWQTWDQAYPNTPAGATIWLDGTVAATQTYKSATVTTLNKAITVRSINPRGAVLAGVGVSSSVAVQPTAGQTINLIDLVLDGAQNTSGPPGTCLLITTQAVLYTVNLTNCLIKGWTGAAGAGIEGVTANILAKVNLVNCDLVGDSTGSAIRLIAGGAGAGLTMSGGSVTLTNQNNTAQGPIIVTATAAGTIQSVSGVTISSTLQASLSGGGTHYTVYLEGAKNAYIGRCTINGYGNGTARAAMGPQICTNGLGGASEFAIDDSVMEFNTLYVDCNAAARVASLGVDGTADDTKANRCIMRNNTITCSPAAGAVGTHGAFVGHITDGQMYSNTVQTYASPITLAYKNCTRMAGHDNIASGSLIAKGDTNGVYTRNALTTSPYYGALQYAIKLSQDPLSLRFSTGVVVSGNIVNNNGSPLLQMASVEVGSSGAFDHNSYAQNTGSLNPNPFSYQGTNYTNFAAWKAAQEPTGAANFP